MEAAMLKGTIFGAIKGAIYGQAELEIAAGVGGFAFGGVYGFVAAVAAAALLGPATNAAGLALSKSAVQSLLPTVTESYFLQCMQQNGVP
jgi:hypothetical protein